MLSLLLSLRNHLPGRCKTLQARLCAAPAFASGAIAPTEPARNPLATRISRTEPSDSRFARIAFAASIAAALVAHSDGRPTVAVMNTVKGRGTAWEDQLESHYLPPEVDDSADADTGLQRCENHA